MFEENVLSDKNDKEISLEAYYTVLLSWKLLRATKPEGLILL